MSQIGCGYCKWEERCTVRRRGTNLAKMGCPCYKFFSDEGGTYDDITVTSFVNNLKDEQTDNNRTFPSETDDKLQR